MTLEPYLVGPGAVDGHDEAHPAGLSLGGRVVEPIGPGGQRPRRRLAGHGVLEHWRWRLAEANLHKELGSPDQFLKCSNVNILIGVDLAGIILFNPSCF